MKPDPRLGRILDVLSAVSAGDLSARVRPSDARADEVTRVAQALDRLLDDFAARRKTLEALNEIAYAAGRPLDAGRLAQFVVTYARDLLGADEATFHWSYPRRGLVVIATAAEPHGPADDDGRAVAIDAFETAWPVRRGREVAVPLMLHGRKVGALAVRARDGSAPDEIVTTLEVLASQVAPLIQVAHLHAEIRDEQERFGKAFERNPSGLTIARANDRVILEANLSFLEMLGYERDEVVGRRAAEVGFVEADAMRAIRAELDAAGVVRGREMRLRAKDGTVREVIGSFEVADLRGEAVVFGTFLDVTERREVERQRAALEERVRLAERLESMGKMAGGIAHDFSSIIGVILNYASILAEDVADRPDAKRDVDEIRLAAERAAEMTRELLTFSRQESSSPEVLDVNGIVAAMRRMLDRTTGGRVELVVRVAADPAFVRVDRSRIERVILNLVANARDAMPDGGKVTVATSHLEVATAEGVLAAGRYVCLSVADTGSGMSRDTTARAFEPFFTTKPAGRGTGLGLPTVLGIVTEAGGSVRIDSEPGAGTVVNVLLPAAGDPARAPRGLTGGRDASG